jgi:beta-glucosidase
MENEESIDLSRLMQILYDRRKTVGTIVGGCTALALIVSFALPKTYESTTLVQTRSAGKDIGDAAAMAAAMGISAGGSSAGSPLNYIELMKSRTVLEPIIDQLEDVNKVIFCGGISAALEGEEMPVDIDGFKGGDRTHIELPQVQRDFLKALKAAGKTVIFVNCSGSAIALTPETQSCDAIVQVWYAGQEGGTAIADVLFGDYNPCGKLPITFYKNSEQLPDYEDYSMKGRTYRYFDDPLFAFGYGMSYTQFQIGEGTLEKQGSNYTMTIPVTNAGKRDGTEIVQLYIRDLSDKEGPIKSLRAFQRVDVKAGQTNRASLVLTPKSFEFFDTETNTMRTKPGNYQILYGNSSRPEDLKTMTITY